MILKLMGGELRVLIQIIEQIRGVARGIEYWMWVRGRLRDEIDQLRIILQLSRTE